jgi:hypothetical protein
MQCAEALENKKSERAIVQRHRPGGDYRVFERERSSNKDVIEWRKKSKPAKFAVIHTSFSLGAEASFRIRAKRWRHDTDGLSAIEDVITHPDYLKIIGMGKPAIPLILNELRVNGGRWYIALESISEQNPVACEYVGYVKRMKEAWLEWGRTNHYL